MRVKLNFSNLILALRLKQTFNLFTAQQLKDLLGLVANFAKLSELDSLKEIRQILTVHLDQVTGCWKPSKQLFNRLKQNIETIFLLLFIGFEDAGFKRQN